MKIRLSPSRWRQLQCDQYYDIVRCAFFFGYSDIVISEFLSVPDSYETRELVIVAKELGIRDDDSIVMDVK